MMVSIFLMTSLVSGAFSFTVQIVLITLSVAIVLLAWYQDKKQKRQLYELRMRQQARLLAWEKEYMPRSRQSHNSKN